MEKTFEELIDEKFRHYADFYKPILIELLQQVREVTIAECAEIAWKEEDAAFIHEQITILPTDRILTP